MAEAEGRAENKVVIPETDFGALADDMVGDDAEDSEVFDEEEGGDPSGEENEEGHEEEVLKEEGSEEESEESSEEEVEEEAQPEGEPSPGPDMAKLRQTEVERLVGVYALSDDDARMLTVEPEKVLPKRMAEMHVNIVEAVVAVLGAQLPQVVTAIAQQEKTRGQTEETFYKKFPALKDAKYRKDVENSIRLARQQDPTGKTEDILTQAGILASLKHRIALPKALMGDSEESPTPAAKPAVKRRGFVPAGPGSASGAVKGREGMNEFERLADDFLKDD